MLRPSSSQLSRAPKLQSPSLPQCALLPRPCTSSLQQRRTVRRWLVRADPGISEPVSENEPSSPSAPIPPSSESPVVEASNVLEASDQLDSTEGILPLLPDSSVNKAIEGYTALCVAHFAVGAGMGVAAAMSPSLLLPSSISTSPLAATMLGCSAVALVRVASILWFLRHSAFIGEAPTWRHQRLNAAVAAFAAVALVSQLFAAPASAPILSGLVLVLSAGTCAFCVKQAQDCWPYRPWLQWLVDPEDLGGTMSSALHFLLRDLTSIAGAAGLGLLAVCTFGLSGLGQASGWSLSGIPHTCVDGLYAPGCSAAAVQTLNGLRRLCIAGFIPAAMVAHSLLELATHVRVYRAKGLVASELMRSLEQDSRIGQIVSPPPERFTVLFWLGLFVSAAAQAFFLLHAPSLGVDVNRDWLLMAPLHWAAWLSGLFSLASVFVIDWVNVQLFVGQCLHTVFSLVSGAIATLVMKYEWQAQHKL